jgi:hypothetical protein
VVTSRSLADPGRRSRDYARPATSPWEFRLTDRVPNGPPRPAMGIGIGPVSAMMGIARLQRR